MKQEFYKIFPAKLRDAMSRVELSWEALTELRFRCGGPVMLLCGKQEYFLTPCHGASKKLEDAYRMPQSELKEMMEYISNYSFYAYEEEIRQGFLTIQGGHRIGFCGKVVLEDGKIRTIRNISFLNVRIAHEQKGCAEQLLPLLMEGERLCHTLIVSPPGCGKTTLLRDTVRLVSNGTYCVGRKVGVVDERSEIAACYHGVPQNDVGLRTDVLDCCPKALGIGLLLRSMSPEVIAVDELGGKEDILMVQRAIRSGCSILATAHGDSTSFRQERGKPGNAGDLRGLLGDLEFERYIFLTAREHPGEIEAVYDSRWNIVAEQRAGYSAGKTTENAVGREAGQCRGS
ncbi:MAG: stage III sporulation protein AA [Lachnospiraceae bacterium]